MGVVIAVDDPRAEDVCQLLAAHLAFAHENSPPEDVHALDLTGLLDPAVSFFGARVDGQLVAIGALKRLDPDHAELKSMHTAAHVRGQGYGRAMLDHLIGVARRRGYRRLSIETGTGSVFAPARSLYKRAGFTECPPFADYFVSPNSVCMTMELD
jgi:putative acetyltransferase